MNIDSRVMTLPEVADITRRALVACGASGQQLELAVQSVVDAECDGIRTVGLNYLPLYCGHLQVGKLKGDAVPGHEQIAPSAIRSNAATGFAHAAYAECEDDFYALAKQQGIAALSIVDSYSAGVVGWFVQRMASNGLIGLGFANSPSAVAPTPGASAFFGTNPMAFAVPRGGQSPIVADMATSQVALVTIKKHAAEGKPIPFGWGYDKEGNPTENLLVDILAGVVSGPNCSFQAPVFKNNTGGKPRVGQFFIAISPDSFSQSETSGYEARLEIMLTALANEPGVRLPGARRDEFRKKAEQEGVEVPLELITRLETFAAGKTP